MVKRFMGIMLVFCVAVFFATTGPARAKWYTNESLHHQGKKAKPLRPPVVVEKKSKAEDMPNPSKTNNRMYWFSGKVNRIYLPYRGKKSYREIEREGAMGISNDAVIVVNGKRFLASPNIVKIERSMEYPKGVFQKGKASLSDIKRGDLLNMLVRGNRVYQVLISSRKR